VALMGGNLRKKSIKIFNISVNLENCAVDAVEPEGGWTDNFSLLSGSIASKPRCVVEDGCISSPDWPDQYLINKRCEIKVVEDTVFVALQRASRWQMTATTAAKSGPTILRSIRGPAAAPVCTPDPLAHIMCPCLQEIVSCGLWIVGRVRPDSGCAAISRMGKGFRRGH